MSQSLDALCARAVPIISRGTMAFWFRDCEFVSGILVTPHADLAHGICQCFLPRLQAVYPGLEVRVVKRQTAPAPKRSLWKAGSPPAQSDLLD